MLGSLADADDAVQETWLRLARSDISGVQNLGGWLTTVAARVCLDMLRARAARRGDPLHLPGPVARPRRRPRARTAGPAGRLGRARAARGARHPVPHRAARVRAARRLRGAVRGDRAN